MLGPFKIEESQPNLFEQDVIQHSGLLLEMRDGTCRFASSLAELVLAIADFTWEELELHYHYCVEDV